MKNFILASVCAKLNKMAVQLSGGRNLSQE